MRAVAYSVTNLPEFHPRNADASNNVHFGGSSGTMKGYHSVQLGGRLTF